MDDGVKCKPPIVILARPQMGENIGAAARAMMNCGLSELRLVVPRDGWPNAAALPMAAGGRSIIENAIVFDTVAAAAHDVTFMVATSARRRDLSVKSVNPRVAADMMRKKAGIGRAALLFGPEASGLDNDEVVLADVLAIASLNPAYPSLNLAQGVLLLSWEWRMADPSLEAEQRASSSEKVEELDLATVAERDYFFKRLETELEDSQFFSAPHMMIAVKRNIRALYTRASLRKKELNTLHGVVKALRSKHKSS